MKRIYLILITLILLLLCFYKPVVNYSEYLNDYNEDIIGTITFNNNSYLLLQGLDNEYYLNHDDNKDINNNGSIFLGYETDLNRNQLNEIYIPNNNKIDINDEISINYLDNQINYKIVKNNNNKDKLLIYLYENNKIVKILNGIRV